ncbi:MAG: hypothetical protein PHO92_02610 [Candidatus Peribacteraceae bacterium]|nr:hypothetical protein [Candidatus Peribacteraceae bacterium]
MARTTNTCVRCGGAFFVTPEEMAFYEKVSPVFAGKKYAIPVPTHCPDCRQQRRVAQANQMHLYRRKCSYSGEEIVSNYHPSDPYPVYKQEIWWSDKHDPLKYGRDFDFSRPFFEQYNELLLAVPRHNINTTYEYDENADYTNYCTNNKNCYLIFDSDFNRDCYYCYSMNHCESCMDCFRVRKGELCYQCIDCVECYGCKYVRDCTNCSDSWFLANCIGCKHCLLCSNQQNKEYCVRNQKVTPEEFERHLEALRSRKVVQEYEKEFEAFRLRFPQKYMHGVHNEDATGDYITNSKHVRHCFDSSDMWDCTYCYQIWEPVKDSLDLQEIGDAELCYDSAFGGLKTRNLLFTSHCFSNVNLTYCTYCMHCADLFGCVGMRRNQYCIFNKQYSREEYEKLAGKIIEHMQKTGEWGEYFPVQYACFPYNTTLAQDYYPLTKQEVLKRGWKWRDEKDEMPKVSKTIAAEKLPDSIADIPDDILNWAISCEVTRRPFRIIKQELDLYRQMQLPIPHLHFEERHRRRMALRNPRKLWKRPCQKCHKEVQTTFAPERPAVRGSEEPSGSRGEIVYCEECYRKEVY